MAERYLIVIDMQNDFVTGSLGSREAEKIVQNVLGKVNDFKGKIYFTQDTHDEEYMSTQEGRCLPEIPVYVDAACCAGVTPESHMASLKTMESCQIHIKD